MKIDDAMVQWLKNLMLLQIEYKNFSNLCSAISEVGVCVGACVFMCSVKIPLCRLLLFSLKTKIKNIFNVLYRFFCSHTFI